MIELVIFDMAGTTINEDNLVYKTMHQTLVEEGVDVSLETVLALAAGKEKKQALYDVLDHLQLSYTIEEVSQIHHRFNRMLLVNYSKAALTYTPGALELFDYLRSRGIRIAFNTGYSRHVVEILIQKIPIHIPEETDLIVCADDVVKQRPAPDMIELICEKLGVKPENSMKVGDSAIDVLEGVNAGVKYTVGITTGAHNRSQLNAANPNFVVDHLSEIQTILEGETQH